MVLPIFYDAKAHIKGNKKYSNIDGFVYFKETKQGILVTAKISGLPRSQNSCMRKIFWFSYP